MLSPFETNDGRNAPEKLPPHRWSWRPKLNVEKSKAAGHNVYEDAPWIDIQIDSHSAKSHHATEREIQRYRRSYEAFLADSKSEGIIGSRLEEWAPMSRSMVEEFRYHKIRTVEELAEISDPRAEAIPQGKDWRERARQWLAAAKAAAPVEKVNADYRELKARFDALETMHQRAMSELSRLTGDPAPAIAAEPTKRRPGRPRKTQAEG